MKRILNITGVIVGLSWIYFFYLNWKIALCVVLVMWSNNLMEKAKLIK